MKMLLHSILLFLAIAASVTSGFFGTPPRPSDGELREWELEALNRDRVEYGREKNVGNMHEMKADDDLLKTAVSIANCDEKTGKFEIVKKSELRERPKGRTTPNGYHPLQTQIACVKHFTTCKKYDEPFCLLGPLSNPTDDQIQVGTLGSKCTTGVNTLALCNAPKVDSKSADAVSESSIQNGSIQKSILISFFFALAIIVVLV